METKNNAATVKKRESLSGFEWFGLISGIVGLFTNIVTLATIFTTSQSPTKGIQWGIWIFALLSIIVTTISIGFYSRYLFTRKHKRKNRKLTKEQYQRIREGAGWFTTVTGTTLLTGYGIAFTAATTPSNADVVVSVAVMFFIGGLVCFLAALLLDYCANSMYRAFDSTYSDPDEMKPTT